MKPLQKISNRSFQVIEPPIYEELNWNMDMIMKALEYLRKKLPIYLIDLPKSTQYYLIVYGDFLGNEFPAIGVMSDNPEDDKKIPSFIELYDRVEKIITEEFTINKIKIEALKEKVVTWDKLRELKYYPR